MSAGRIDDLCKAGGPRPYGPNWVWNGSGWSFVRCDLVSNPGSGSPAVKVPYQSAFSGALDGSADVGIVGIEVPRATPPNVIPPGGSIGEPVVNAGEDVPCACMAKGGARSIFWLVGVGMLLWLI